MVAAGAEPEPQQRQQEPQVARAAIEESSEPSNSDDSESGGPESSGASETDEGEGYWDIEKLVDVRTRQGTRQYLVKWEGYPSEENTWEAEGGLPEPMIAAFTSQRKRSRQKLIR